MACLSALGLPAAAVLLVLCLAGGVCGGRQVVAVGSKQREFDYFKLTLLWPGTMCQRPRRCCSANACCRRSNSPNEFTIHGLWPDYNDGSWPACCERSNFNENEIAKLHDSLEKYWPSFTCNKSPTCYSGKGSFWAHEWEKHGTCCSPVIQDEYNYFLTALNIFFKYNVTKVLYEAGYVPSNTEKYPLGGIVTAIQNAFHVNPEVLCAERDVEEIRLCFHKDFKPRDCGSTSLGVNSSSNSCPKLVNLPEHVSPRHAEIEMLTSSIPQKQVHVG